MQSLPRPTDPRVLSGTGSPDDAGVFLLADGLALVQTVDFFTPVVDDPYDFGRIAAANALSDIYAMGATPITALAIVGFPREKLPLDYLEKILQGGISKATEAGCSVIGGHSIDDNEPKYGLAVTGTIDPDRIWRKQGARPGDLLILTKPLGTGVLATAIKAGKVDADIIALATETMATLNRGAAEAVHQVGAHAVTDITGFGLCGHLMEMTRAGSVTAHIKVSSLPVLPETLNLISQKVVPGGTMRNLEFVKPHLSIQPGVTEQQVILCADAQTSGGLLIAVAPADRDKLIQKLQAEKTLAAAVIGIVTEPENDTQIVIEA